MQYVMNWAVFGIAWCEIFWSSSSNEGLDKYLAKTDNRKMIEENPNNKIYYDSLVGEGVYAG